MMRQIALPIAALLGGIVIGAYLFSDTQPRAFLRASECGQYCFNDTEILGLLGSVGIQKFDNLIPLIAKETDKTLAIKHPFPRADIHYVIIPKKDIRAAEDISEQDTPYIMDAYAIMSGLIREQNLRDYKIVTNGPGFQTLGYLHFQLISDLPE